MPLLNPLSDVEIALLEKTYTDLYSGGLTILLSGELSIDRSG